jgi:transposase
MIKREDLEPLEKEDIINLFVDFAEKVEKQIQQMQEDIRSSQEENRQLKMPKNSQNSSRPPSHDFGRLPRQKSLRKPSGKKTGGQQGHSGNTFCQVSDPDEIIVHKPSGLCPKCGKIHTDDEFVLQAKRQIVDIPPIQPIITEHQVYQLKCDCGHEAVGQFPAGVNAPVKYGNRLTAFVSYLTETETYIVIKNSRGFCTIENEFPNGFPIQIYLNHSSLLIILQ